MPDARYYLPPWTGARAPSQPSSWASHFVDVKDYGAVGDYQVATHTGTDNTAAIQAAIDSSGLGGVNEGKVVLLSSGRYKTTSPLNMREGTTLASVPVLRGMAVSYQFLKYGASIEFHGGPNDNCIQAVGLAGPSSSTSLSRCVVERLKVIDRRTSPTGGNGVYFEKVVNQTVVRNMDINGFPTGSSVKITAQTGNVSDCVTVEDIWGLGSQYAVNVSRLDNTCFIRDIKLDTLTTDPLIAGIYVSGLNGVCLISGVKHENNKLSAPTVQLDGSYNGTIVDGIVSRFGNGGPVVSLTNSIGVGVTLRGLQRQATGTLLAVNGSTIVGTRLPFWVGASEGYQINGARVAGQFDSWLRVNLEGQICVALTGGRVGFYGTTPIAKPALTYSRATETAASTQLRTTLVNLGLVTDSTVP